MAIKHNAEPTLVGGGKGRERVEFSARKSNAHNILKIVLYFSIFNAHYQDCPNDLFHDCS